MTRWSRRRALAAAGGALGVALAGCSAGGTARDGRENGTGAGNDAGTGNGTRTGTGTGSDGGGLTLDSLDVGGSPGGPVPVRKAGTVTVLDFFATWCAPCVPQMAELRSVRSSFPDVHMLSITAEGDAAAVRSFWREHEGTWPVALDPDLAASEAYGATRVPTLVVLAPDGTETKRHTGLIAAEDVAAAVQAAGEVTDG